MRMGGQRLWRHAKLGGALVVAGLLGARVVSGAEKEVVTIPDGWLGAAGMIGVLTYLAKSIYVLVRDRRRGDEPSDTGQLNTAAWQLLTNHMEREERLFESLTATVVGSAAGVKELLVRQESVVRVLDGIQHTQEKLADTLGALADKIRERV